MSKIVLLRHGRTRANDARLYCGATDEPLSPQGLAELRAMGGHPAPDGFSLFTSGMARTQETLRALYGDLPAAHIPGLSEMNFGAFEMRGYEEMKENPDYLAWITDETGDFVCPGGESANRFKARIFAAFDELVSAGKDILIVTHGGVIANLMARAFPDENRNFYEWQPPCGRGYATEWAGKEPLSYKAVPGMLTQAGGKPWPT